jgi:plasmid maintenance system antidote protein VapI
MAVRLEEFSGESAESWLARQAEYELSQINRARIRVKRPRGFNPG